METLEEITEAISKKMADIDWMNPLWPDELKEASPNLPDRQVDQIYEAKLREKVESMSPKALENILKEERTMDLASQNILLQKIVREKIARRKTRSGRN